MHSELHTRSAFSFLRGASQPQALAQRAAELGYSAIALTDHGGFYGSARAHHAARECGIRAIVGTTLDLPDGSQIPVLCPDRHAYQSLSRHLTDHHLHRPQAPAVARASCPPPSSPQPPPSSAPPHFDSKNKSISPSSRPFATSAPPRLNLQETNLIALTGDRDGPLSRHLLHNDKPAALAAAESLIASFGRDNVYVEINRHNLRDDGRLNRHLIDLAAHLRLPLIASNAPLHATRADRMLADAFTCLRHHLTLDQAGHLLAPNGERHLKSPQEMAALFADLPEALANTRRLSERLDFTLENLGYRFPDFPDANGKPLTLPEQNDLLRHLTYEGATGRYGVCSKQVRQQLEKELALIDHLGFAGYFLIVHDIVRFARGKDMLCQGRGSAANSAVCYSLGITGVDPVGGKLLFERFLSESRASWPDIDIDFPSGDRREEVIQYVFRKYGPRGAAMTANVITYRPRSAFREMSKVLGFPLSLADRFSKVSQSLGYEGSDSESSRKAELEESEDRLASLLPPSHPRLPALSRLYHAVLGLPRHLGQHSGGIIICDRGLDSVVPIQPATMPGRTVVQWDKDDCEDLGIVKIDLLGLGILAAMEESFAICKSRGNDYDTAKISREDPAVFDLLSRVDTIGTFQVESRAQMATLPIMKPREFYDLAIQVAIIRPGPIVGDLIHPYLNRRTGKEAIDYIHPKCEPILGRTLGVPLFQEQMLRMAMEVAGFSGAEAEELRRAVSFKRSDERLKKVTVRLREAMTARGVDQEVQEKIIRSTGSFSLYGFPESHAISFAWLAYLSCWLKVHHPAEFFTGLINNQPMGFYSVNTLIQDAKRRGLRFLPVSCVHSSRSTRVIDDRTLRLGLDRIKALSKSTITRLLTARESRPFGSLEDFLTRAKPAETERRALARGGVLNDLPKVEHRRQAMWQAELPLHDDLLNPTIRPTGSHLPMMSPAERISSDYATQSSSAGPHPMKLWRESHGTRRILRATDLANLPHGLPVTVAGLAICRQRPGTAKGHCFISLEDETGISNLFVPKTTFHHYRQVIVTEPFLLATGRLQRSEGDHPTLYVTHIEPLTNTHPDQAPISHDFH